MPLPPCSVEMTWPLKVRSNGMMGTCSALSREARTRAMAISAGIWTAINRKMPIRTRARRARGIFCSVG